MLSTTIFKYNMSLFCILIFLIIYALFLVAYCFSIKLTQIEINIWCMRERDKKKLLRQLKQTTEKPRK